MIPVAIAAILTQLASAGLSTIGNAILAKGKDAIEAKLGVDISASLQTEEGKIKLLQLQHEHEEFLLTTAIAQAEQDIKSRALDVDNTKSARDMNTRVNESATTSWLTKNVAALIACVVIVGGGVLLATTTEADVRTAVVGLMTLVLGFYFGSTSSSRAKDDAIHALSNK